MKIIRLLRPIGATVLLAMLVFSGFSAAAEPHPGEDAFVREVAKRHGVPEARLKAILDGAVRQQSVLDAIARPAEAKPWKDYRKIFLTPTRIDGGVAFYQGNRELLERTADTYGVDPEFIVAILGVETSYGVNMGKYRVLDALATLAFYYPPRASFFRSELEKLLTLPEHLLAAPIDELKGSYAGAMGWGQFMPSSIAAYARDGDGDGHIDLMNSLPDITASVANYLKQHGWKRGAPVTVRAQAAADARMPAIERSKPIHTVGALEALGFAPLRQVDAERAATLVKLEGERGTEYWITFGNFEVITRYNRSALYAMAVTQLANAIMDGAAVAPAPAASAQ